MRGKPFDPDVIGLAVAGGSVPALTFEGEASAHGSCC
jgi:hypothetical protein